MINLKIFFVLKRYIHIVGYKAKYFLKIKQETSRKFADQATFYYAQDSRMWDWGGDGVVYISSVSSSVRCSGKRLRSTTRGHEEKEHKI